MTATDLMLWSAAAFALVATLFLCLTLVLGLADAILKPIRARKEQKELARLFAKVMSEQAPSAPDKVEPPTGGILR
jgi:hypothetical protein